MSQKCVPVPVSLLRAVTELSRCEAHGLWCWTHETSPWPCPVARLRQYIPDDIERRRSPEEPAT